MGTHKALLDGLEHARRLAVRKTCLWSAYEDSQSEEFRRGVEWCAAELAGILSGYMDDVRRAGVIKPWS